ncbi:bifunctional oligoribonuclease/PAP phosphatase NrnA, partial [Candidatus Falkowbacteria bacterium]|nr:bifunctional oligoribonuclease/PAP phosphatase NrnA [Candidatus Falkowbacteria bacterium]
KKIYTLINESSNILLICHRNPDGDTLGSALALAHWFKKIAKNYTIYCQDKPALFLSFLPGLENIKNQEPNPNNYDLIITCDCGDQTQTGVSSENWNQIKSKIINIDHHFTNTNFGNYNLISFESASTSAILYKFFKASLVNIDRLMATCLLTGLVVDTCNFSNPGTNQEALEVASRLVAKGAQIRCINNNILKNKSLPILKLWSRILLRLQKNEELGLAWTIITKKDKAECGVDDLASEGISNFFNELADSNLTLVLEEIEGGFVKGSLRTTTDHIDVSRFAKIMGGGGHQRAAGFRVKGRLKESDKGWSIV